MQAKLKQGEQFFSEGDFINASHCFRDILRQDPDHKEALNNMGVISFQFQDLDDAENFFKHSLESDPYYSEAYINLSQLLFSKGHIRKAVSLLEEAVEKLPDNNEIKQLYDDILPKIIFSSQIDPSHETGIVERIMQKPISKRNDIYREALPKDWIGPVVIGGVGGSGTRLIARLIQDMGFYTGTVFNQSDDNQYFTHIFSHPLRLIWGNEEKVADNQVIRSLEIFEKAMLFPESFTKEDLQCLLRYALEIGFVTPRPDILKTECRLSFSNIFFSMMKTKPIDFNKFKGWGWKEPCSYIYLKYLASYFPAMKYIHIIRHGLDMAFSANTIHLQFWGWFYDLDVPDEEKDYPFFQLKLWNRANKSTRELGREILGNNFLIIRFEDLCSQTEKTAKQIIDFLKIETDPVTLKNFVNMLKVPDSINRYKKHDLGVFDYEDIKGIKDFGYDV